MQENEIGQSKLVFDTPLWSTARNKLPSGFGTLRRLTSKLPSGCGMLRRLIWSQASGTATSSFHFWVLRRWGIPFGHSDTLYHFLQGLTGLNDS